MARDTSALTPAEPTLWKIAREHWVHGVFYNPNIQVEMGTVACLKVTCDNTRTIELEPGHSKVWELWVVLHECGHAARYDDPVTREEAILVSEYRKLRQAGHPPSLALERVAQREEAEVESWAWEKVREYRR